MAGAIDLLFPTYFYRGSLPQGRKRNREFKREMEALEALDDHGRAWSRDHYVGGYSSYSSMCRLHQTSPNFADLEAWLAPHVRRFIKKLNWDLQGREVRMTTCWANAMGPGTYHTLHTHPGSVISGVYYVDRPAGASPFKIEDPRMAQLMAAPPRRASAPSREQNYLLLEGRPGDFFLFESWMRHEVPPHRGSNPRLSISFNYEWL